MHWPKALRHNSVLAALLLAGVACAPAAPAAVTPSAAPTSAPAPAPALTSANATATSVPSVSTPRPALPATPTRVATPVPAVQPGEKPVYGGVMSIVQRGEPPSLNAVKDSSITTHHVIFPIYEYLLRRDPTAPWDKIIPDLAESWEVSPNGLQYTFRLRKDVKWQDGKPFTAEDAAFFLRLKADPPVTRIALTAYYRSITKVDVVDPYTVRVTLARPDSVFLLHLSESRQGIPPAHLMKDADGKYTDKVLDTQAVGTGPFKLKEWKHGVSVALERNPQYRIKELPYLDGITYYIIPDRATQFAAFRSGRVDITSVGGGTYLTPAELQIVQSQLAGKVSIYYIKTALQYTVRFNPGKKPFDDLRVRQAAHLATDRQTALKLLADGVGAIGGAFYPSPWAMPQQEVLTMPGFRQPKDQDAAKAKQLMADAGYTNGTDVVMAVRQEDQNAAVWFQNELRKIGIRATLRVLAQVPYWESGSKREFPAYFGLLSMPTGHPDDVAEYYVSSGQIFSQLSDAKLDAMFDDVAQTVDVAEARKKSIALDRYISVEQVYGVVLVHPDGYRAAWNRVRNLHLDGAGQLDSQRYEDTWKTGE